MIWKPELSVIMAAYRANPASSRSDPMSNHLGCCGSLKSFCWFPSAQKENQWRCWDQVFLNAGGHRAAVVPILLFSPGRRVLGARPGSSRFWYCSRGSAHLQIQRGQGSGSDELGLVWKSLGWRWTDGNQSRTWSLIQTPVSSWRTGAGSVQVRENQHLKNVTTYSQRSNCFIHFRKSRLNILQIQEINILVTRTSSSTFLQRLCFPGFPLMILIYYNKLSGSRLGKNI